MSDMRILAHIASHPGACGYDTYIALQRGIPLQSVFRTLAHLSASGLVREGAKVTHRSGMAVTPLYVTARGRQLLNLQREAA